MDKHIYVKSEVLSEKECQKVISYIDKNCHDSRDYEVCHESLSNSSILSSLKKCMDEYVEEHKFLASLYAPWEICDQFNLQKYAPGRAYFGEHMEHGKSSHDCKRLLAWMIYLNDVTDGGGTRFPQQNFTAQAKRGDLYIWPAGWTHSHHGIVSNTQTKYIATGWCAFQ